MTREEIDELAKLSHEKLVEQYPTIWAILESYILKYKRDRDRESEYD